MESLKYGGLERHFVELARQARSRGHRLTILYNSFPSSREYLADMHAAGARVIVGPMPRPGRPKSFLAWFQWLSSNDVDLVHVHFGDDRFIALAAARAARIPLRYVTLHGALEEAGAVPRPSQVRAQLKLINATRAIAVARLIEEQYRRWIWRPGDLNTVYLGIAPDATTTVGAAAPSDDRVVILCCAFHHPVKGLDVLLEAASILRSEHGLGGAFRILQCGPTMPETTPELLAMGERLNLEDAIEWLGPHDNVPALMSLSDIYCQPSRSEGLPLAVVEAQMAGLPVVASNVGGVSEAVVDSQTGFLVEPGDPRSLAQGLARLIRDTSLRVHMGSAAVIHAEEVFDLAGRVSELLDLYEADAKPRPHRNCGLG